MPVILSSRFAIASNKNNRLTTRNRRSHLEIPQPAHELINCPRIRRRPSASSSANHSRMKDNHHHEISQMAYRIWVEEGKPEGKALEHWHRAEHAGIKKTLAENLPNPPEPTTPEDYG